MTSHDGQRQAARGDTLTPMHIANHPLFTPREKIELLHAIRQEVSGLSSDGYGMRFSPADVDEAINEVQRKVTNGAGQRFTPGAGAQ